MSKNVVIDEETIVLLNLAKADLLQRKPGDRRTLSDGAAIKAVLERFLDGGTHGKGQHKTG